MSASPSQQQSQSLRFSTWVLVYGCDGVTPLLAAGLHWVSLSLSRAGPWSVSSRMAARMRVTLLCLSSLTSQGSFQSLPEDKTPPLHFQPRCLRPSVCSESVGCADITLHSGPMGMTADTSFPLKKNNKTTSHLSLR